MNTLSARSDALLPLGQTLPDDVGGGWLRDVLRYRRWPVFSVRWLLGRFVVFGAVLAGLASLSVLGMGVSGAGWAVGFRAGGWMMLSFLLMAFTGPVLAGVVRYRRFPLRRERLLVVLAVLLGMGLAFFVDQWGSAKIESQVATAMDAAQPQTAAMREEVTRRAKATWVLVVNVGVLVLIYSSLGGGLALSGYFREDRQWRAALERRRVAAMADRERDTALRLAVLQAQVEPHFLFNTLASIRALVATEPQRAIETLDALADHLRATMPTSKDGLTLPPSTLGQQLEIAASYLAVMRLRLGGRLSVRIEADDATRAQPFPPLLLITLVENAIKHGIEPKRGLGEVRIVAHRDADMLQVSVIDDGLGLVAGQGGGVGLANVRAQLAASFGDRAQLSVSGRSAGGCEARLRLPWTLPA